MGGRYRAQLAIVLCLALVAQEILVASAGGKKQKRDEKKGEHNQQGKHQKQYDQKIKSPQKQERRNPSEEDAQSQEIDNNKENTKYKKSEQSVKDREANLVEKEAEILGQEAKILEKEQQQTKKENKKSKKQKVERVKPLEDIEVVDVEKRKSKKQKVEKVKPLEDIEVVDVEVEPEAKSAPSQHEVEIRNLEAKMLEKENRVMEMEKMILEKEKKIQEKELKDQQEKELKNQVKELKQKEKEQKDKDKERAKHDQNGDLGVLYYSLFKYYRGDIMPPAALVSQVVEVDEVDAATKVEQVAACADADTSDSCTTSINPPPALQVLFHLETLNVEFDPNSEIMTSDYYTHVEYDDPRLAWDPQNFTGGITKMSVPSSKLWRPDINLHNRKLVSSFSSSYQSHVHQSSSSASADREYTAELTNAGHIHLRTPSHAQTFCYYDKSTDLVVCPLKFVSWSLDSESLDLQIPLTLTHDHCLPSRGCEDGDTVCLSAQPLVPRTWILERCEAQIASNTQLTYTYYFQRHQVKAEEESEDQ